MHPDMPESTPHGITHFTKNVKRNSITAGKSRISVVAERQPNRLVCNNVRMD